MRQWARAPRLMSCGFCKGRDIKQGDPVLYITLPNVKREMRRCTDCAGPAPPDLPPLVAQKMPGDFSMVSVSAMKPKTRGNLKEIARQWMPYREPGEDG
jgi:hypothetical protein